VHPSDAEVDEGTTAPDFVALAHDGSHVALSELRGRTVILFFYTKDDTPLATREAIDFRDAALKLRQQGIQIIGVSTDAPEAHREFAASLRLPFPLLSDPNGNLARAFGVPFQYGLDDRRTFVIGPSGTIEKIYREVTVPTHVADVVSTVSGRDRG
jgi:peroxiredoxin Q/BCP